MKYLFSVLVLLVSLSLKAESVLSVNEIEPGIYVHWGVQEFSDTKNHGAIANIGFIIGQRCVAVIDSGGNPEQGKALKNAIENVTSKPICYVINTHVHPDHIYGNSAFKDTGAKFVGHEKLARAMSARGDYYLQKAPELLGIKLSAQDIIPPDITVSNHLDLDLGRRKLKLTAHPPAHTDNDLSVYDQQTDTLWLADLLFIEHLPSIDGSLKGWLAEMDKLESKTFKTVIPGHGTRVTNWPKAMQPQKEYLNSLLLETRTAIKNGVFLEDAVKSIGLSFKDRWKLFDEFNRKNVTKAYAEMEWED
ncbi:MAG: quinoprotein relay system zinc metallohydrolase 2 [Methylococcaceae bacterium]|nr:quinoprotein relay system zinc metallohydrolase 2 [Methylococcaceae bacterium]